ncbi:MAG: hypothetical protein GXY83_17790, partial [Rhodopirellula sp.]|nr:hypothetical protein [Rhodopirellula sp.]
MKKFSFPVLPSVCVLAVAVVVLLVPVVLGGEPEIKTDVLLRGGSVLDGSGGEATVADVAIRKGKIVAVGKLDATSAGRVIDCSGMIVAPGFIDLHTHCGIRPHPRTFGTFPRKIGFYARREKVLNLAQAVRSATGLPADI